MDTKPPPTSHIVSGPELHMRPGVPEAGAQTAMYVPLDCIAMIRLPMSIPAFCSFAKAAEQAAPGCVVQQCGEFLMALKVPQKEGK